MRLPAGFLLVRLSGRGGKGWLLEVRTRTVPVAAGRDPHRFLRKDEDEVKRGLSLPQIKSGYIDDPIHRG